MKESDELFMRRCVQLASLGKGWVAPNPMVGAVLVYQDRIIGEGFHQKYGGPHAEVNCLRSVRNEDQHLIPDSTLYVSLEPCAHYGKTPPCAELIIKQGIRKVVVGCRDPFVQVNGKGIEKLRAADIEVRENILEKECLELNQAFFTFHQQHRPFVFLKWAQTSDGKIAGEGPDRLLISNEYTNRIVHRWRAVCMSILVGTNTAMKDDPELTLRYWKGRQPIRMVVDKNLQLPVTARLFNGEASTIVFNLLKHTLPHEKPDPMEMSGVSWYQVSEDSSLVHQILQALYFLNIQSVLVEGGTQLLQSFIDEESWDVCAVITNEDKIAGSGLPAPLLKGEGHMGSEKINSDRIDYYKKEGVLR